MFLIVVLLASATLCSGEWISICSGEGMYRCNNGDCIKQEQFCDGINNCLDGSDENSCHRTPDPVFCNRTHQFLCTDGSACIPLQWMCNDRPECYDGSDEAGCTDLPVIPPRSTCNGFECDRGTNCISPLWVCDDKLDCMDESDEVPSACPHFAFTRKLPSIIDCEKNVDAGEHYRCTDNSFCVPKKLMCDGVKDCRDGSDEGHLCDHWTTMCTDLAPCKSNQSYCYPHFNGPRCGCTNRKLSYNVTSGACEDVGACKEARPRCSHHCEGAEGGIRCRCEEGYTLDDTKLRCLVNKKSEAMLFFSTKNDIRYISMDMRKETVIMKDMKDTHGVTYDGKYVYWVQRAPAHLAIMKAELNHPDTTNTTIVSFGIEDPGDIAVDWLEGHIYFTDVVRGAICVCHRDGTACATLPTAARMPRFITLATRTGQMYWADHSEPKLGLQPTPALMAAFMDGSGSRVLPATLTSFPTAMALDEPNGRLYYVDKSIEVLKLDDMQSYTLFVHGTYHPYALAVFEDTVYWSDLTTRTVQMTDKLIQAADMQREGMFTFLQSPVFDMHMYHPTMLQHRYSPCEYKGCSHLCLAGANDAVTCVCPDSMVLKGSTCEFKAGYRPRYVVIAGGSMFARLEYDIIGNPEAQSVIFDIARVQAMAYDSKRDALFIYDGQRKTINSVNMRDFSSGNTRLFVYERLDNVVDMEYDYSTDSLYIVDAARHTIEVISVPTQRRALVFSFTDQEVPVSICLLPEYGRMLVAIQQNDHRNVVFIDSFAMDGTDRKPLAMNDLRGPRVVLRYDQHLQVVYMADAGNNIIDIIYHEGSTRSNFRVLPSSVTSMTLADPYVFWTDRSARLYWANVHQEEYVRKMEFSIFSTSNPLHIEATSKAPDSSDPLLNHPCLVSQPCFHVCVQGLRNSSTDKPSYTCLCPTGSLLIDGKCTEMVQCKENELYCHRSNGCFDIGKLCDKIKDCKDGEDEEDCAENGFQETGGCHMGYKLCNGICIDVNDKCGPDDMSSSKFVPVKPECKPSQIECANSSVCIERADMCNRRADCPDGSDEDATRCMHFSCEAHEFRCAMGSCIARGFHCDGSEDCQDGSDEVNCGEKSCQPGFYQCRNKECIEMAKRCNRELDCYDSSDEDECEETFPEEIEVHSQEPQRCTDEYTCLLNRSICLPLSARCDNKKDCPEGTDELDCEFHCYHRDMFKCQVDKICIERYRACNGHKDCSDGSDETKEACEFMNRTIIPIEPIVLPAVECHDGFLCSSGQCLEWWQVCDGIMHCYDGSDENGQCATACKNATCNGTCHPAPSGPVCRCAPGWVPSGNTCVDVDECQQEVCSQQCQNLPGSFFCSCYEGFFLRKDRRSCKTTRSDLTLLYLSGNTVWSLPDHRHSVVFHHDPKSDAFDDMAADIRKGHLYTSVAGAGQLTEVNSTDTDIIITNIGRPTKMAVDWITGNVYFVDNTPSAPRMRACNVMKRRCAKLHELPSGTNVTALAVDPPSGQMFYCVSRGADSVIWSSSLDGRDAKDLGSAEACASLAVDSYKKLLYVAEVGPGKVIRMDFDGKQQRTITLNGPPAGDPTWLAVFGDSLYYLAQTPGQIAHLVRCSLFGKRKFETVTQALLKATSVIVHHPSAQRGDVPNPCDSSPCPGLCVAAPAGPRCVCDEGDAPVDGLCPLLEKEQLPLFNGWTFEEYKRAANATVVVVSALLAACALYAAGFLYQRARRSVAPDNYLEVHFQNANTGTPAATTTVVDMDPTAPAHEFVNPLEYVRDWWEQVRGHRHPIGTAGLDINVPYVAHALSDTESDLDERESKETTA